MAGVVVCIISALNFSLAVICQLILTICFYFFYSSESPPKCEDISDSNMLIRSWIANTR